MVRVTDRGGLVLIDIANVTSPAVFRAIPPHKVVCRYRVTDPTHAEVWHIEHHRADSPMVLVRRALEAAPAATLGRALTTATIGCQAWIHPFGDASRQRCLNDFIVLKGTAIVGHSSTYRPNAGGEFRDDPPGDHQVWFYKPIVIPPDVPPTSVAALREALIRSVTLKRR